LRTGDKLVTDETDRWVKETRPRTSSRTDAAEEPVAARLSPPRVPLFAPRFNIEVESAESGTGLIHDFRFWLWWTVKREGVIKRLAQTLTLMREPSRLGKTKPVFFPTAGDGMQVG
jgi:hypothetical protein